VIFNSVRRGAVVVAHPDDEVMWVGGLLARYGEAFTVICCSIPARDPVRAWKFFDACAVLGAAARLMPFQERPPAPLDHLDLLDLSGFDLIVTHNAVGEYGHAHHVQLHRHIKKRWPDKTATFGWAPDSRGEVVLHLTADEQAKRLAALKCYDHVSPSDGRPKWEALLDHYAIDLRIETHHAPDRA
jgi:LmbE family N-acetylglucosaminyl deacetylase